jgi:hypothetical protein
MNHLKDRGMTYFGHLTHAWITAIILIIHGVFPNLWPSKASERICPK